MLKRSLLLIIALIVFGNNSNAQTEPKTGIEKPPQVFIAKPTEKSNSPEAVKLLNSGIELRLKGEYELTAQDLPKQSD